MLELIIFLDGLVMTDGKGLSAGDTVGHVNSLNKMFILILLAKYDIYIYTYYIYIITLHPWTSNTLVVMQLSALFRVLECLTIMIFFQKNPKRRTKHSLFSQQ